MTNLQTLKIATVNQSLLSVGCYVHILLLIPKQEHVVTLVIQARVTNSEGLSVCPKVAQLASNSFGLNFG